MQYLLSYLSFFKLILLYFYFLVFHCSNLLYFYKMKRNSKRIMKIIIFVINQLLKINVKIILNKNKIIKLLNFVKRFL